MAFDGIVTKAIACELKCILEYKIDKIYEPTKNSIILGLYGNSTKLALNICIDSSYYRINLTTHSKPNPSNAPNFCMLLRKHLIGSRVKNIITYDLERIVILELQSTNNLIEPTTKKLIVELMGKHSNIILVDNNNIIIDSLRHTNIENNSSRNIFPHKKYEFPKTNKLSFLKITSADEFYNTIKPDLEKTTIDKIISDKFVGISKSYIKYAIEKLEINDNSFLSVKKLFDFLKNIIKNAESYSLSFEKIENDKDYALTPITNDNILNLNFFIDDFYYEKENTENFISYRNSILKLILEILKKYNNRLLHINDKLKECENMDRYKLYGELLIANLYKIDGKHLDNIDLENYYDNNKIISIPLDSKYTTNVNAEKYFKKYNKLKNALNIVTKQKQETTLELNYIESIVYELENCSTINEVQEIFEEISDNVIFKDKLNKSRKKAKVKKNKSAKQKFTPLEYNIDGYTVLVGKNNKENDFLTTKLANSSDIWFHTKDIHGSHVILKTKNDENIENNILVKCAKLAVKHSKAKNSSNVPVDYCKVKYVKKPIGSKPGMVIYTHNKTLYVNP